MYLYLEIAPEAKVYNCRGAITAEDVKSIESYAFMQSKAGLKTYVANTHVGDKKVPESVLLKQNLTPVKPISIKALKSV